jgi:hypothetical protein
MMVMMACFALFRLDQRAIVLLPGNLVVAGSLLIGAVAVAMNRPFSFAVGLAGALVTSIAGLLSIGPGPGGSRYARLPGYPLIWVVIGLYIAFRLVINRQHSQRMSQKTRGGAPESQDEAEDPR